MEISIDLTGSIIPLTFLQFGDSLISPTRVIKWGVTFFLPILYTEFTDGLPEQLTALMSGAVLHNHNFYQSLLT